MTVGKATLSQKQKIEKLVDLKYEFDLLTNELFQLKEYISLIEFDPTVRNDTDSFERFLESEKLTIIEGDISKTDPNSKSTPSVRRSHRHQLRATSVVPSSADNKIDDHPRTLNDIDVLVQQKYYSSSRTDSITNKHTPNKVKKIVDNKNKIKKETEKKVTSNQKPNLKRKHVTVRKETNTTKQDKPKIEETIEDTQDDKLILNQSDNNDNDSDDYYFTTSSEEEIELKSERHTSKKPHITITLSKPHQTITNPLQVIKNTEFAGLPEYLDSFRILEDDMTIPEYNKFIDDQKHIVKNLRKALTGGLLTYDFEQQNFQMVGNKDVKVHSSHKPDPISYIYKEQHKHVHQDYLMNQGIFLSRIFQNSRKARIARAKKVSQMIEHHFKHIAGAEERKIREEEKRKKVIVRTITQAIRKRWNLAEKAFRVLRKDEEEELKRIQGKKHLSKMLERSTQLLGAQLNQGQESSDVDSGNDEDVDITNDSELSVGSYDSDDNLSSSSDEEDTVGKEEANDNSSKENDNPDDNLSAAELRSRYENMPGVEDVKNNTDVLDETDMTSNVAISDEENSDEESENVGLDALFSKSYNDDNNSDANDTSDNSRDYEMGESGDDDLNLSPSDGESDTNAEREDDSKSSTADENDKQMDIFEPQEEQLKVVDVPVPSLLRGTLRVYQKQGLNWLASLYNNNTNGILADEMGLGKTIQTISLLAWLACEKENWGPHLIIVPTSVLLNWEMEFKRFAPGLKVLTYYGSPQQRKEKRKGWNKPDAFHVCIVSYQLVVQDQHSFKRKKWEYMILDEAHNIKNFRSTRWQALLNFNTKRRLLLTGTPLQNNLGELWSLLYFLMPQTIVNGKKVSGFADLDAFQQWFGHPVDKIIETSGSIQDEETKKTVTKLHQVLRPYLLRRLKADVEKQMPAKYEHIVYCRLSKRQRYLYDDFMARSKTKETLASGNFMSIVNCLMQLRKVCNHPDLFEVRPILTSFESDNSVMADYSLLNKKVVNMFLSNALNKKIDVKTLGLQFSQNDKILSSHISQKISELNCGSMFERDAHLLEGRISKKLNRRNSSISYQNAKKFFLRFAEQKVERNIDFLNFQKEINELRCNTKPVYGRNLIKLLTLEDKSNNEVLKPLIKPLQTRFVKDKSIIDNFAVLTPKAATLDTRTLTTALDDYSIIEESTKHTLKEKFHSMENPFHHLQTKLTIAFPDKSLLQYDCGKLQKLATLLQDLKDNGHRALIFTQMTKVLDILEQFLNYHGYLYMRLDGATKVEDRQILTERFNSDDKVTVFILSSRSGGLGINLTGADTVIFYDSDWNPAMDKQCQDRCHRIGQTRDVHIYRFVSEHTIESNILKKANQKRQLDNVVIQEGDFTTDYFSKLSITDLLGGESNNTAVGTKLLFENGNEISNNPQNLKKILAQAEDADDVKAANLAMKEVEVDDEDFTENVENADKPKDETDEYEGTLHIEEYMIRLIANGYYY
ncbi:swr1 complex component [Maudiozyma exigua]|uniref:Helicase SWR1 n=1 Tax=Maudiozyma exigua TaxID=34358 RepID=A0A9P7B9N2_MAUEX|nr:swr1 complex component [Kazachstania exigua]